MNVPETHSILAGRTERMDGLLSIKAIVQCYVYSFALRLVGDPEAIHMSEKSPMVRSAARIENAWSLCGG
jgi:hypothetical protein